MEYRVNVFEGPDGVSEETVIEGDVREVLEVLEYLDRKAAKVTKARGVKFDSIRFYDAKGPENSGGRDI